MQSNPRQLGRYAACQMTATKTREEKTREVLSFLPRQDRHQPKGPEVRSSKASKKRAYVLIGVHVVIAAHIWYWLQTGSAITPVEPSEAMQTVELGKINAGFLLFVGLIASTLIFGRWFCGWACHVVALQDLCAWMLAKLGLKPRPVRSRLLVFAPWVVAGYMFIWPPVHAWLWSTWGTFNSQDWFWQALGPKVVPGMADWQWELETSELWQTFPGPIMAIGTFLVAGFLIVWWLGAKGFCTYGCPYGAFFSLADRVAPMRIKVNDACEHCGHCTSVCTSNVRVHEEVAKHGQIVDPGCMKCMDCVSVCPNDALSFGFALPKPFATSQQRVQARADFVWWEEVLLALVAFVAVQWTFRGAWFGEGVPLLLAVGLGVITAVLFLLFVRLLVRREVTFQHTVLKQAGKRSNMGTLALLLVAGWLLLTGHTFVGQRLREGAKEVAQEPIQTRFYSPRNFNPQQAQAALEDVEYAASWALMPDPQLRELRALLRTATQREAEAEAELLELYQDNQRLFFSESSLVLARMLAAKPPGESDLDLAEELVLGVIRDNPNDRVAPMLLTQIRRRKGG